MIRIEKGDGSTVTVPYVEAKQDEEFNKQWTLQVLLDRERVNQNNIEEGVDEVYLEADGVDKFGGVVRDVGRSGSSVVELIVDSFERYAREAEPYPTRLRFDNVDDSAIVSDAISRIPQLSEGTIENIKSDLVLTLSNVTPAKALRIVRDVTKGKLVYRPDKTIDYVSSIGADKTNTVLSPSNQNIENFKLTRSGGSKNATHLRMLGGGTGDAQTVIEVVSDDYETGDRQIWSVYPNKEIANSDTLRAQGEEIIDELNNEYIEAETDIFDETVDLGDTYTVRYPEEQIDTEVTVVELTTIRNAAGLTYDATLSTREISRFATADKVVQDVERFNRSAGEQVISTYDDPTNAPEEEGNLIYVTGSDPTYERGVYYYNGASYEGTQYPDVDAQHVYAGDSFVVPVGTDQSGGMVLPVGTDKYDTT